MKIGEVNELRLLRITSSGAFLGDEDDNDVLLPGKYLTEDMHVDDMVEVFLYRDSEDRIVATTERPLIDLYGFAYLECKEVGMFGAFVDWGLEKDLLIPFREQRSRMEEGRAYLVSLQLDDATDRLYGTTKLKKLFGKCFDEFAPDQAVELLVAETSDLGVQVVVNNRYSGLIYASDVINPLHEGMHTKGFVYNVRPDGKLDVRLQPSGGQRVFSASDKLLEILQKRGKLNLHDKSSPEEIREAVGMSKKTFKQALGNLYKQRLVTLSDDGVTLNS